MSQRWVSDIERGATENPHLPTLRKLADVLSLDIADLLIAGGMASSRSGAYRIAEITRTAPATVALNESRPAYDDDAPLTPDEEAIFVQLVFRDYAQMSNAQKRMIVEATKRALDAG